MNTMSEATTSPVQNEIPSKTLVSSLLTCTYNTNNSEESMCFIDSLTPETVNNIVSTTISNEKIGICDKLRTWNVEFNVSHNCCFKHYVVLKGKLKKNFYVHFLHLVTAIRILVTPETCISINATPKILLDTFVKDYVTLYGEKFINYNVHSLIHLPFFVLKHGPLESFSCFKYENLLQEIKKFMKCSRFPLQVVSNRIYEKLDQIKNISQSKYPKLFKELPKTPHLSSDKVYEKVILKNVSTLNINSINNNFIMLKNKDLVFVEQILMTSNNEIKFLVRKCNSFSSFFNLPNFSSNDIGSYSIDLQFISTPYPIQVNDFKCKCFYIQISVNKAVVITLCHDIDIPQ
ncbi:unnamed protein product [Macrosiphum euphorbiae]|uniref:DUF4218 domain-containing protein n=1 Tax=Macrosiphum euphorbiae TaxID=13131 RepID=A0AAV0WLN7_9HEMI|nr:unnamed protein product [Macrosiphum euphorbiae]